MARIADVLEASRVAAGSVDKLQISPGSGPDFLLCTSLRHPEMSVAGVAGEIGFLLVGLSCAVERMAPRLLWIWWRGRISDEF